MARAATFNPATVAELVAAINAANANGEADTIELVADSTYTLTAPDPDPPDGTYGPSGLPAITSDMTINGHGATITRAGAAAPFRILRVTDTGTLRLNNVTISNGSLPASGGGEYRSGGGICNQGVLIITSSTVSGNSCGTNGSGGGINNVSGGALTIRNCVVSGNSTASNGNGGGIMSFGTLTVQDSSFSSNTAVIAGGALSLNGGPTTVTYCTFSDNVGQSFGGGIYVQHGDLTVAYCTFATNRANTAGTGAGGGGIYNYGGMVTVTSSTFTGNVASTVYMGNGGGVYNYGAAISPGVYASVTIANSTFSGNSAAYCGGGIYQHGFTNYGGTTAVRNSTVYGNYGNMAASEGGGIYNYSGGRLELKNSIVAGNTAADNPDIQGQVASNGYNLVQNRGSSYGYVASDLADSTAPNLNPLAPNGGPTLTHALQAGSPAIDAIPIGTNDCASGGTCLDQRGAERAGGPGHGGAACDIGAYEYDSTPTAVTLFDLTARAAPGAYGSAGLLLALVIGGLAGLLALNRARAGAIAPREAAPADIRPAYQSTRSPSQTR